VQTFVPQVANGDKRVFFVDGEPIGRMNRVPPTGEWRANIHLGAKPAPFELSDRDNEIVAGVVQLLKGYDLPIACIDIIGDYLTEINVTSPSGIPEINSIYGKGHEARIVDYLEQRQSLAAAPKGPRELG
jgi:glutathione synthase